MSQLQIASKQGVCNMSGWYKQAEATAVCSFSCCVLNSCCAQTLVRYADEQPDEGCTDHPW